MKDLLSPKLLKVIAIWSLIPSYLLAGGGIGYGLDRWLKTFPYITGIGLLVGFCLAVRDMLRLKQEWHR
jgi:F0F1-type ATP synthase assembly protein I